MQLKGPIQLDMLVTTCLKAIFLSAGFRSRWLGMDLIQLSIRVGVGLNASVRVRAMSEDHLVVPWRHTHLNNVL